MITLHAPDATSFVTNGLGVVSNAAACEVVEQINGEFSATLSLYAADALQITEGQIIAIDTHRGRQPFRVQRIEKYMDRTVRVYALHLSYDLLGAIIEDRAPTDTSASSALSIALEGTAYSGTSNVSTIASARWVRKSPIAAIMGEDENSLLNRWGGEVERDGYAINLLQRLGADRGVSIRYQKNLTGLTYQSDMTGVVTRIMPTGLLADGQTVLLLPEKYVDSPYINDYPTVRTKHIHYGEIKVGSDLYADEAAALDGLRAAAAAEFAAGVDQPVISLDVKFVDLSQTMEYSGFEVLERVYIGDTVHCYHEPLGITASLRVVGVKWDALRQRYVEITLGQPFVSISQEIAHQEAQIPVLVENQTLLQAAIDAATGLLNAPGASYLRFYPSMVNPAEMYVMDAEDPGAALNVVRLNSAGLGVSETGINGPYRSAIIGSGIVADAIMAGTIGAAVVFAGELFAARGTIDYLITGIEDAQHMQMGMDANGDPYLRAYNGGNTLKVEVTPKGVGHRAISGTSLNANTGEWSIGTRVGIGIFVG